MALLQESEHGTLVAATVTTVTIAGVTRLNTVTVVNMDGVDEIYAVIGVEGTVPANPTVGGADSIGLASTAGAAYRESYGIRAHSGNIVVKLISAGTPQYSVLVD